MNWRVVVASARLDLQRTRKSTRIGVLILATGVAGAVLLQGVAAMLGLLLVFGGFGAIAGTSLASMNERKAGRVVWWRTLPADPKDLMLGRLLAVALRGVVACAGLLALLPVAGRIGVTLPHGPVVAACAVTVALLVSSAMVLITGVGLRYRVERILAAGFLVVLFGDILVGDRLDKATSEYATTLLAHLVAGPSPGWAMGLLATGCVVLVVSLALGVGFGARAIAIAEESNVSMSPDEPPRIRWRGLRYPAPQRSLVSALTLMNLRIAAERIPQQVVILGLGAAVMPYLPESPRHFAAIYLPMMALAIPGQATIRTALARRSGTLEGWATLPVRRELISFAAVLAIAALAALATALILLVRLRAGTDVTVPMALATWGALTAAASLSNGMAAWFRPAHFVIAIIAGLFVLMVVVIAVMGVMLAGGDATSIAGLDPWLPVAVGLFGLLLLAPLGGALYGRGLERFELVRK